MPDPLFSSARLRGYRILEAADLGTAEALAIQSTIVGAQLWLPISLIEVAFRNLADRAIGRWHPNGASWFFAEEVGDVLDAPSVGGAKWLHLVRDDGSVEDPVRIAARKSSAQTQRTEITRDDVVAHLTLGFWITRVPAALDGQVDVFDLIASGLPAPLDSGDRLRRLMVRDVLRIRNRIAHHEPLLFRRKHVILPKSGEERHGADLVVSMQGALRVFQREAVEIVEGAKAMVPAARAQLDGVLAQLKADVEPLATRLDVERERMKAEREARRAAKRESP